MLVHADNLSSFDARAFVQRYEQRADGVDMTMMTFSTTEPQACGIVELDKRGIVRAFHEKIKNPPGNLANAAIYILSPSVMDFLAGLGKEIIDFSTEVLPHFMGRINVFHNDVYHRDIGTLESLSIAQNEYPAAVARQRLKDIGELSA
jgi:mannose-1-phosphate guanylyltransferase